MTMSGKRAVERLFSGAPMREADLWAALDELGDFTWRSGSKQSHRLVRRAGVEYPFSLAVGHDGVVKAAYLRGLCRHFALED